MARKLMTAAVALLVCSTAFAAKPLRFDAVLEGFNAGGNPVQTNATGQARVEIIDDGTAVYFQIEVSNIRNLLMAHIHVSADPNVPLPVPLTEPAGPIAYWFTGGPTPSTTVTETIHGNFARGFIITDNDMDQGTGNTQARTVAALIEAIKAGRASVVVHTDDLNPDTPTGRQGDSRGGEIRGTLQ